VAANFEQANLFELGDYSIQVTYSSTSFTGQRQLSYRDNNINRNFMGEEIQILDTDIGQLVTVTLETIADLRIVTFTLILPLVNVIPQSGGTRVQMPGILTTTHTTIAGPGPGAEKTYSTVNLQGTAQFVVF
jgi:hypothetical protein